MLYDRDKELEENFLYFKSPDMSEMDVMLKF